MLLFVAHHAEDEGRDEADGEANSSQNARVTRANNFVGAAHRKGLRTFRLGDTVTSTVPEGNESVATFFSVTVAHFGTQLRRLLVLCESNSARAKYFTFFAASVTCWARTPADGVSNDKLDPDNDNDVKTAPDSHVKAMLQVRCEYLCCRSGVGGQSPAHEARDRPPTCPRSSGQDVATPGAAGRQGEEEVQARYIAQADSALPSS
eukprot:3935664-Pleurochrysis_carterae.AAC.1